MHYKSLKEYFDLSREKFLNQCVECGQCVENCKVMEFLPKPPDAAAAISGYKDYLRGGELSAAAHLKLDNCMRCYGCVRDDYCPIGLDSMLLNEMIWRERDLRTENPFSRVQYPDHMERIRRFANEEEQERILTERIVPGAEVVLFPGCNVYRQPDKVLNMLDIMDAIGIPYSFLPGMKYCCGQGNRGGWGDAQWLQYAAENLFDRIAEIGAKKLVLWCPTCACNIAYRVEKFTEKFPCEIVSMGGFMLENIDKISFPNAKPCTVTLHEPCKTAFMGIDLEEIRNVLRAIPGTTLVEMEHHHENAMCCGCLAVTEAPETGGAVTHARLEEAKFTSAEKMLDVCHNCHWVFCQHQIKNNAFEVDVENYSTYIASAMGICRKDTAK